MFFVFVKTHLLSLSFFSFHRWIKDFFFNFEGLISKTIFIFMNVLILGSGGREHALSWKIAQSSLLTKLFIAPGNAGTIELGENVDMDISDFKRVKDFCLNNSIDMLIVGPEIPLVEGVVDFFRNDKQLDNIRIIGPDRHGAMLEGSKEFAKEFMEKYNIPTAAFKSFKEENIKEARAFLRDINPPFVIKADGLAAGKGVLILDDLDEAYKELDEIFSGKFGEAGNKVVIEDFLKGIELSVFILADGSSYVILPEAKDYKRIGEGDTGLNTGGMGAVSPVPFAGSDFLEKVENRVIKPTMRGLKEEGIDYKGFIFIGLMNMNGDPYVIEYNVRMGDPEAEVVIPRIKSDLLDIFKAVSDGTLDEKQLEIDERSVTTVMLVSGGYPEDYKKGIKIDGLDDVKDSIVFHAGTKMESENILTNGGRVLAVSSYGNNFRDALEISYENAAKIEFKDMYFRKDIGFDL